MKLTGSPRKLPPSSNLGHIANMTRQAYSIPWASSDLGPFPLLAYSPPFLRLGALPGTWSGEYGDEEVNGSLVAIFQSPRKVGLCKRPPGVRFSDSCPPFSMITNFLALIPHLPDRDHLPGETDPAREPPCPHSS